MRIHIKYFLNNFNEILLIVKPISLSLFQAQIVVLAAQILWSEDVEAALHQIGSNGSGGNKMAPLERVLTQVESTLNVLADSVLQEQPPLRRKKLEHLVRQRCSSSKMIHS